MSRYIPKELKQLIQKTDRRRCCYCLTSEHITGIASAFDHIYPLSQGGQTCFENVCLACRPCNEFKNDIVTITDPLMGNNTRLFHPRQQNWTEHFEWDASGAYIIGKTACSRATVTALKMNNSAIVGARKRWAAVGWHPPANT